MFKTYKTRLAAAFIAACTLGTPALAGQCPAGQDRANPLVDRPTAPKDVTDDVIGSIDLGKEVQFARHDLRMRRLVVQPGGIVPFHSHVGRPALILTESGEITEYRTTCAVPIVHHAGELSREADGLGHYWVNQGSTPAVLYSADVKAAD